MSNRSCHYLKWHFIIPLEAELEECHASCWPHLPARLPASCSSWCRGRGMSWCQEIVLTWEAAALQSWLAAEMGWGHHTEPWASVLGGQGTAGSSVEEKHLFSSSFCRNGTCRAVRAWQPCCQSLTGAAAPCLGPGGAPSLSTARLFRGQRGCWLRRPCGSSAAGCLWNVCLKHLVSIYIHTHLYI